MLVWGYLGLLWALICLGLLSEDAGPKAIVPTMPPLFPAGEFSLPRLEKYRIFDLLVVGNGGPLMLVCSNVHVFGGFSIFGNEFSTAFGVSHRFVTPIKGCRVTDSFMSLAGFKFLVDEYG